MIQPKENQQVATPLLGDYLPEIYRFSKIDALKNELKSEAFLNFSFRKRFKFLAEKLIDHIQTAPDQTFLLPTVLEFINTVNDAHVLEEFVSFPFFEFWLNHFSNLTPEENQNIRNKIMGKAIPRDAYQAFFPIGMGKIYKGSHYVTAHLSPDVDTMIASFWGWVDAFAARVGTGLHVWCLPGGPPESPVTTLFKQLFGSQSIEIMARYATTLTLSSMDLVTHKSLSKKHGAINISNLDHGTSERAIVLVDEEGHYRGDWRSTDVELVRQVIILFKASLRWFENNLHYQLIDLFGKKELSTADIPHFLKAAFCKRIADCDTTHELSQDQTAYLDRFLKEILRLEKGIASTFSELDDALVLMGVNALDVFEHELADLEKSDLFDDAGRLREDRSLLFKQLETIYRNLNHAIFEVRNWAERLDVSIAIKEKVLNIPSTTLTMHSEVDVIRGKMNGFDYLCVTTPEENGFQYPVGVVWDKDLRLNELGTVSFRDFSNFEEVKMASYLTVISVIDHHKTSLSTLTPPMVILGDTQSCNVLVAEQTLSINDRYSLLGLSAAAVKSQLQELERSSSSLHLRERLLQRRLAAEYNQGSWISPAREYMEYLFFIHAILDDTDLLTKVSARDVVCVAELINRLKSLQLQRDVEVITLDDIAQDSEFAKNAAKKILHNEEMYSIYKKSFDYRNKEIEENLRQCIAGKESNFFADTKIQNGCSRIGQTKVFPLNIPFFAKNEEVIQSTWVHKAREANRTHPELDLHLFMVSTIASAQDLYEGLKQKYTHQDELWFWIPQTELAQNHLASFLSAFAQAPEMIHNQLSLETWDPIVTQLFKRYFIPIESMIENSEDEKRPKAILRFQAGTLNSRKAMVSPYLPKLLA